MAFTFSSDLGAELGKYLAGGEVEESLTENKLNKGIKEFKSAMSNAFISDELGREFLKKQPTRQELAQELCNVYYGGGDINEVPWSIASQCYAAAIELLGECLVKDEVESLNEDTPNNAWDEPLPKYEVEFYGQYDQNYDSDRDLIKGIQNEDNFPIIIKTFSGYTKPNAFGSWAKYDDVIAEINDEDELYDFINSLPVNESCKKVEEGCDKELNEAKGKGQKIMSDNPEALAEELEEIEMDLEDFGPEGFYNVPYESFKKEFPEFTKDVIETFLIKFVELKPEELNDPEVIEAWKSGDLITEQDWSTLLEGARDLAAGKPTW